MRIVNLKNGGFEMLNVLGGLYCGRGSVMGNRFVIGRDGDRKEVIEKYRKWLWEMVKERNEKVFSFFRSLNDKSVLGCWCKDGVAGKGSVVCHCDVIYSCWLYLKKGGLI